MWSDNESGVDFLGFRVHSEFIYEIVTDKKMLPVTIGLFGDWGSGKTSVMKMLEESLSSIDNEDKANIICLYFNGWQFEGYDDAKSAILSSILMQLAEHKRIGEKIKDKVVSLMKSVNWMRLISMGAKNVAVPAILAYLTGGASLIPSLAGFGSKFLGVESSSTKNENENENVELIDWEALIKADKSNSGPLDVRTFRGRFSEMLKDTKIDALVILIDDLDRCSPDRIIDNLEAIKLFLNVDNTAFVIGADPRIVRYAVERRYLSDRDIERDKDRAGRIVDDYLEKLIQIPYHLPRLSPSEIESYMNLLFCYKELDEESFFKVIRSFNELRNRDMYSIFGYSRIKENFANMGINTGLEEDLNMCSKIAPLITDGLKGNPRQVKRFLNAFMLRKKLAKVANLNKIRDDILVKLMVLEYVENDCFRELYNWQASQDGFPKELESLESENGDNSGDLKNIKPKDFPRWQSPFLKKWLRLKPTFEKVDLRDYFWIVRDKMESTLSDTIMISPFVNSILDDLMSSSTPKKNRALKEVEKLESIELNQLLNKLGDDILRNQKEKNGFEAFIELIQKGVLGSSEKFASVLEECNWDSLLPLIAINLQTLFKAKPGIKQVLEPIINKKNLKAPSSKFSKAYKEFNL